MKIQDVIQRSEALLKQISELEQNQAAANMPLTQKLYLEHAKKTLQELLLLLQADLSPQTIIHNLENFLGEQWEKIKGDIRCYTAMPESPLTHLMCDIALDIAKEIKKPAISILMPGVRYEYTDFEEKENHLKEFLKTHIVNSDGTYLLSVRRSVEQVKLSEEAPEIANHYYEETDSPSYAYLKPEEIQHVFGHSHGTQELLRTREQWQNYSKENMNLLSVLEQLILELQKNSKHGVGTEGIAGEGVYEPVVNFRIVYDCLDEEQINAIHKNVSSAIEKLFTVGSPIYGIELMGSNDISRFNALIPEKQRLYIIPQNGAFRYKVFTPAGEFVEDMVSVDTQEFQDFPLFWSFWGENMPMEAVGLLTQRIADVLEKRGHIKMSHGIDSCIDQLQKSLNSSSDDIRKQLSSISINKSNTDKLRNIKAEAFTEMKKNLLSAYDKAPYCKGHDPLGCSVVLLEEFAEKIEINSLEDLNDFRAEEFQKLCESEKFSEKVFEICSERHNFQMLCYLESPVKIEALLKSQKFLMLLFQGNKRNSLISLIGNMEPRKQELLIKYLMQELVESILDFKALFNNIKLIDSKAAVALALVHKVSEWTNTIEDFLWVMKIYAFSEKHQNELATKLIPKLPEWVRSLGNIMDIMNHFALQKYRDDMAEVLIPLLTQWTKSLDDSMNIMLNFQLEKYSDAVMKEIIPKLTEQVNSLDDFMMVMRDARFSDKCRDAMAEALIPKLPLIIDPLLMSRFSGWKNGYINTFMFLLDDIFLARYKASIAAVFITKLPEWVNSFNDFMDVMTAYRLKEYRDDMAAVLVSKLPELVTSLNDFMKVMSDYNLEKYCDAMAVLLIPNLPGWVNSLDDFIRIMKDYHLEKYRGVMADVLIAKLPQWIDSLDLYLTTVSQPGVVNASTESKNDLFQSILEKVTDFSINFKEIIKLAESTHLSKEQKLEVLKKCKDKLPALFHEYEDCVRLLKKFEDRPFKFFLAKALTPKLQELGVEPSLFKFFYAGFPLENYNDIDSAVNFLRKHRVQNYELRSLFKMQEETEGRAFLVKVFSKLFEKNFQNSKDWGDDICLFSSMGELAENFSMEEKNLLRGLMKNSALTSFASAIEETKKTTSQILTYGCFIHNPMYMVFMENLFQLPGVKDEKNWPSIREALERVHNNMSVPEENRQATLLGLKNLEKIIREVKNSSKVVEGAVSCGMFNAVAGEGSSHSMQEKIYPQVFNNNGT